MSTPARPRPIVNDTVPYKKLLIKDQTPIGSGASGAVYRAIHRDWGCQVAYKKLGLQFINDERKIKELKNEAEIHRQLRHLNIVSMLGVVFEEGNYGLVLEYVPHGSLDTFLNKINDVAGDQYKVSWKLKSKMAYDICSGMSYLHTLSTPVIHGDLKLQNIIVTEQLNAKISDFGLSKWKDYSRSCTHAGTVQGTASHIPPEKWANIARNVDEKFDIYSFGILMWELFTGKKAFENCQGFILQLVMGGVRPPINEVPSEIPESISLLVVSCWDQLPEERPSFKELSLALPGLVPECEIQTEKQRIHSLLENNSLRRLSPSQHGEKLNRCEQKLSENIRRTEKILAALLEKKALSLTEYTSIRSQPVEHELVHQLVDVIANRPVDAYQSFIDALQKTDQAHLCRLLEDKDFVLNDDHKNSMIDNYTFLLANITVTGTSLVDHLYEGNILDEQEVGMIRTKVTERCKINQLLHFMLRSTPAEYRTFLESLANANQQFIADKLRGSPGAHRNENHSIVTSSDPVTRSDIDLNVVDQIESDESDTSSLDEVKLDLLTSFTTDAGIWGLTELSGSIFVIGRWSKNIAVYDSISFCRLPDIVLKTERIVEHDGCDLTSCVVQCCLYINYYNDIILRVSDGGRGLVEEWLSVKDKNYVWRLSVTAEGQVLLPGIEPPRLDVYSPDAMLVRTVQLASDVVGKPRYAMETSSHDFVMIALKNDNSAYKVFLLNRDGVILRTWANEVCRGGGHLAIYKYGHVFVTNSANKQLILLDSALSASKVILRGDEDNNYSPWRLCYSKETSRLLVAHRVYGRLDVFSVQ